MSQFRQNPISKNWVLIAPKRSQRPEDFRTYSVMYGLPELDPTCVFCPGNEHVNPDLCNDVCRLPNSNQWEIRVIPNKYRAVEHIPHYRHREFYHMQAGYGDHEVIVTRKHNEPVAMQSAQLVEQSLKMFSDRIKALSSDPRNTYVQIFHNHGRDAGASLAHPHYQILTTPFVPPDMHAEINGCYHYYQIHKSCIYCDIVKEEIRVRDRLIYEDEHFTVISPYAARSPFETWILPKKHSARYEDITEEMRLHLAHLLKRTLGIFYTRLSDPPLNFYIHTMPVARSRHMLKEEGAYHWHLTIFPRITIWAGFEYATGIPVNPMTPEQAASFMRGES